MDIQFYWAGKEAPMAAAKTRTIYRSAKTGEMVTKKFAETHKSTTEKETRPAPKPKRGK